ncbi:MAG TPA: DUF2189 domain-containing protein [Acidocella sp.]|jgi:uncharacterized membrane protein|uniref:DUF2189 domain-containing protein n=1 Tax=Acidocella sp. TaxID=50710 RepID=UPI002CA1C840|nr:DUF2189 domain-containing protein [Acidocella sp.]HVE21199.1 DUF2189 domain-containing protein [Acidocella sp.]
MHIRNPIEWAVAQLETPSILGSAPPEAYWPATRQEGAPEVQQITLADLRESVRRGLHDFAAGRADWMFLWLIYPILGLFIALTEARGGWLPLLFPTAAGFALIGPFCAVGLYEMSRQREITGKLNWLDTFNVLRSPSIGAIAGLGLCLIAVFLAWLLVAQEIYDVTLGPAPPASAWRFMQDLFTTPAGWAMIGMGWVVGVIFAVGALAISVVSFPLLLDRPVGLVTAIATSVMAVRRNPVPLGLWGVLVVVALLLGAVPCFIGLVVVLPVLGHATWHLYRRIVRPPAIQV